MDLLNICLAISASCLIAVTIPALWKYFVFKYKLRHMKGPRGLPLLGNILQLGSDNVDFMNKIGAWAEEFRDSGYYLMYIGTKPILMVYNANDLETILRDTKLDQKAFSYYFIRDWLGDGLLLSVGVILTKRFQLPWLWNNTLFGWSRLGKEHAKALKILHGTTQKVIQDRKLEMQGSTHCTIDDKSQEVRKRRRLAFLDLLIAAQKQDNSFTDADIQEEVDTFMFEGHDTVSASTTFALYLIGKYPEVQRKIQKELDEVFGNDRDRPVTMDDLKKLEYLGCVMKEGQRVMCTVPIPARELTNDFRVCGTVVPKGTSLLLAFYWLHHDPKHFPDPQRFDPDRFLPANSEGRHHFAFLPFSAGHRNCIGQKFAIMEQKVIMATILRKIEVTSLQTMEELGLAVELILRPKSGIHVKLNLRK